MIFHVFDDYAFPDTLHAPPTVWPLPRYLGPGNGNQDPAGIHSTQFLGFEKLKNKFKLCLVLVVLFKRKKGKKKKVWSSTNKKCGNLQQQKVRPSA